MLLQLWSYLIAENSLLAMQLLLVNIIDSEQFWKPFTAKKHVHIVKYIYICIWYMYV